MQNVVLGDITDGLLRELVVMVALYAYRADHFIFILWFLFIYRSICLFLSSPNLSGHRLDVYHTSTHGVA